MRLSPEDRRIWAIAVPAFVALIAEPLLLVADTAIIGRLGTVPLAGAAAAHAVITAVYGACVFLAYSTTAVVSRRIGAGDEAGALRGAVSGIWLGASLGAALGALVAITAPLTLAPLTSSEPAADEAWIYLTVSCAGFPGMFVVLAATGALRGLLDLRTPLIVVLVTNTANVLLSIALVFGAGLGIGGAALGTVIAQTGGAGYLVSRVARRARRLGAPLSPVPSGVLRAALDGAPLVVRSITLQAVLLVATGVAATMGDVDLAAHRIAVTLVAVLSFALDALAIAGQTLTGRHLGAAQVARARALTRRLCGWGFACGAAAALAVLGLRGLLPAFFTDDPRVAGVLVGALVVVALVQPLSGVVFALDGVLIGAGDARFLAGAMTLVLIGYLPLAAAVWLLGGSLAWLWAAYGGFIVLRLLTLGLRARSSAWLVTGA